jgi:hypothetical protein
LQLVLSGEEGYFASNASVVSLFGENVLNRAGADVFRGIVSKFVEWPPTVLEGRADDLALYTSSNLAWSS